MGAKAGATPPTPSVGEVIRRLRTQRGLSVRGLSSHSHTMRNDSDESAVAVGFTTETVY